MFSPNKKLPELPGRNNREGKRSKPVTAETKKRLWTTVALTFIFLFIYYGCIALGQAKAVMIVYFVAFAALIIAYLAYNRAFINKDVTADMLPPEWSEEKKQAFMEDNRIRAEKSRWVVVIIIPFAVVFMCEALYLFVWDGYLSELFKG